MFANVRFIIFYLFWPPPQLLSSLCGHKNIYRHFYFIKDKENTIGSSPEKLSPDKTTHQREGRVEETKFSQVGWSCQCSSYTVFTSGDGADFLSGPGF